MRISLLLALFLGACGPLDLPPEPARTPVVADAGVECWQCGTPERDRSAPPPAD